MLQAEGSETNHDYFDSAPARTLPALTWDVEDRWDEEVMLAVTVVVVVDSPEDRVPPRATSAVDRTISPVTVRHRP
jgi:hypothetical protein